MPNQNHHSKLLYYIILAIATLMLPVTRFLDGGIFYCLSTFFWIVLFLFLTQYAVTERELLHSGLLFCFGCILKYYGLFGSPVIDCSIILILAIFIYSIFLLYRKVSGNKSFTASTLFFPLIWTIGYFIATLLRVPAFLRIDIMFFDMKILLQCEYLIHSTGLTFLILWAASLLVHFIRTHKRSSLILLCLILTGAMSYGAIRLSKVPEPVSYVRTAYSTGPYVGDFMDFTEMDYEDIKESLEHSARQAYEQQAEILIFNEEAFQMDDYNEEAFLKHAQDIALKYQLHLLVGLDIADTDNSDQGKSINKIAWITNEGEILGEYTKYQLIPLMESDYVRGEGKLTTYTIHLKEQDAQIAFAICYDSNFPSFIGQLHSDTDILFLPSWDWDGVTSLHYRVCGTLSVENKLSLLKPTYDGYTIATDPYGRVLHLSSTDEAGYESVQIVDLPLIRKD